MSEENVERFYRATDAFNRRDLDAFLAVVDREVELITLYMEMEGNPSYRGHGGVREWWQNMLAVFPDFSMEVLEVRDFGDSGIAALRVHGHGLDSGVPVEQTVWAAGEWRDGKVTRWQNFGSEAEALKAAGLSDY
jgi:ketosteroid isomerase-like protein